MQSIRKPHRVRTGIIACACAGLLAGGAGAAFAAPSGAPGAAQTAPAAPSSTGKASITLHATRTTVKAGQAITLTGMAKGLKAGEKLMLEHKGSDGKWTPLNNINTTVKSHGAYTLHLTAKTKGTQVLRVTHGSIASPAVKVKVI